MLNIRERLSADRQHLAADSKYPTGVDGMRLADLAADETGRDLDLGLLAAEGDALFEIEEALRRIEQGTFGKCELTGKPIPEERSSTA